MIQLIMENLHERWQVFSVYGVSGCFERYEKPTIEPLRQLKKRACQQKDCYDHIQLITNEMN